MELHLHRRSFSHDGLAGIAGRLCVGERGDRRSHFEKAMSMIESKLMAKFREESFAHLSHVLSPPFMGYDSLGMYESITSSSTYMQYIGIKILMIVYLTRCLRSRFSFLPNNVVCVVVRYETSRPYFPSRL